MWKAISIDFNGVEPFSAITGLAFIFIPWLYPQTHESVLLTCIRVSLIYLGVGTFVFHWIPNMQNTTYVNVMMFDWLPIVFTSSLILIMYLTPLFRYVSDHVIFIIVFVVYGWISFLTMWVDNLTQNYLISVSNFDFEGFLNAILLIPLILCFATYTVCYFGSRSISLWVCMFTSLGFWLINKYACKQFYFLSIFHGLYHVIIAKVFWDAACLGTEIEKYI